MRGSECFYEKVIKVKADVAALRNVFRGWWSSTLHLTTLLLPGQRPAENALDSCNACRTHHRHICNRANERTKIVITGVPIRTAVVQNLARFTRAKL